MSKSFFGHPRGLSTAFFTEMWERFSYYGMRALLFLFMVAQIEDGGLGLDDRTGGAIYGLYTMLVYLLALPGGWLADKFFGLRKAIFYGGCLIAMGHICLALPFTESFFLGLLLIVIGTGLLKPNVSSIVGELYSSDEQVRRDAGFSIFYMGINLGAFLAPILTGYLRKDFGWHYGFTAAAIGMIVGLVQYKITEKNLGTAGLYPARLDDPEEDRKQKSRIRTVLWIVGALLVLFVSLLMFRVIVLDPVKIARTSAYLIAGSVLLYFLYIFLFVKLTVSEKKKIAVIGMLFLFSCMFWAGYEQQGSSLNLFAERYTDRKIFDWEITPESFQSVPPIFVIIFSPVFAWLWVWLAKRKMNPSTPIKFSLGLIFMALGYLVMMGASAIVVLGDQPLPHWLVITYLFHTFGEICLYPIGLSAVTKLSPQRLVGQMMGIWFISIAFGNLIAGLYAGEFDKEAIAADPSLLRDLFWTVVKVTGISGIIMLLLSKPIRKLMGDIR